MLYWGIKELNLSTVQCCRFAVSLIQSEVAPESSSFQWPFLAPESVAVQVLGEPCQGTDKPKADPFFPRLAQCTVLWKVIWVKGRRR